MRMEIILIESQWNLKEVPDTNTSGTNSKY